MYILTINKKTSPYRYHHIEKMMRPIRKLMVEIMQSIDYNQNSHNKTLNTSDKKIISDLMSSHFVETHIKSDVLKHYNRVSSYTFIYKSNKILLRMNHKNPIDHISLYVLIVKMFTVLELVKAKGKTISLILILTTHLKRLDRYEGFIGNNVNSGATYFRNGKSTKIVIFRKEEYMKVTLHELIHFLDLDFKYSGEILSSTALGTFAINKDEEHININEGYTEFMALIYNSIFNSILTNTDINIILYSELLHSHKMANSILSYFEMSHILKELNISGNILIQQSNILAYFFIKYACLINIDYFMTRYPLGKTWTKHNIKSFLIDTIKILKKVRFTKREKSKLKNKSIRMTEIELQIMI